MMIKGRFAPTPSGRMHLGNIYSLLVAWCLCRQAGGRLVLRIEDLDPLRCPRENAEVLLSDLQWLGLDWDEGPFYQSERSGLYAAQVEKLRELGCLFPCFCSRGELHAASAPHLSDGRYRYSGTCRDLTSEQIGIKSFIRKPALRVRVKDEVIAFEDGHYGKRFCNLNEDCGDFIVRRSDGVYAYHLAVVTDDALMGVNQVVRGADLLDSVPVQLYLYRLLGFSPPTYCHIPLLTAADGRRLAKRDKDLDLGQLRQRLHSEQLLGYLAWQIGLLDHWEGMNSREFLHIFSVDKLPQENIVIDVRSLEK